MQINSIYPKLEYSTDLNDFVEIYNKSVGMICNEYIGKHLVIYDSNQEDKQEDIYEVVNSLSEIKELTRVTELYIDGLVITDNKIFHPFANIEHIHGVPILEITDISYMFLGRASLASVGDMDGWDTSNVTNTRSMFSWCTSLTDIGDNGGWDMSNVKDISYMFFMCYPLKSVGDLSRWDIRSCTNMSAAFDSCKSLTSVGDLGGWDINKGCLRCDMFNGCNSLEVK